KRPHHHDTGHFRWASARRRRADPSAPGRNPGPARRSRTRHGLPAMPVRTGQGRLPDGAALSAAAGRAPWHAAATARNVAGGEVLLDSRRPINIKYPLLSGSHACPPGAHAACLRMGPRALHNRPGRLQEQQGNKRMDLSPLVLARIQFAANLTFHILFPAINIALAWILLYFKLRWRSTGDVACLDAYRFWIRVFALSFGLGVVSGLTMSFQFGTTFPGFMERAGNVVGPLLGYEVMTAFFLEAGFLGIMLFGRGRVPEWVHTLAMSLVAFGVTLSAFWILVANSWMQTPAGAEMIDGKFYPTDWLQILFNASLPLRFSHMLLASVVTAAFVVLGVSAWQALRRPLRPGERKAFMTGLVLAAAVDRKSTRPNS